MPIAGIIKQPQMLSETDSVRKASALIASGDGVSAVVRLAGGALGYITEREIAGRLASDPTHGTSPVGQSATRFDTYISDQADVVQVAGLFSQSAPDILPVVDQFGTLRGVVYRRDVIALITGTLKPPSVGGLATPLGVRLTSGNHWAGANDLGMALTGVVMMGMVIVATAAILGLEWFAGYVAGAYPGLVAWIPQAYLPFMRQSWSYLSTGVATVLMLLMVKWSPLSGYHAAEHMTVHAIENGEDLTPENVRRMERVHPRCGSNLLAAAAIFVMITDRLGTETGVLVALVAVLVGWRQLGAWMQRFITTKPPTEKQLMSGLNAGRQLLARYQSNPGREVSGFKRLWNSGMMQAAAGWIVVSVILVGLSKLLNFNIPL